MMNAHRRIFLLIGALALLLALLTCGWVAGEGITLVDAQGDATSTPLARYMMEVYGDQAPRIITLTSTPYPTWTPAPSNTPIPTATPVPSNTPTATPTSTPTPNATIEPTIEVGTPIPTDPGPTLPPPDPEKCYGTVQVQGLRLRAGPYIGAAILGAWNEGDRVWIHRVVFDNANDLRIDEWGEVSAQDGSKRGWSAIFHDRTTYIVPDTTQACLDVRFPAEGIVIGLHPVPGANGDKMKAFYASLNMVGLQSGTKPYFDVGYCTAAMDMGNVCVYRTPPDCPRDIGGADPRESAYEFMERIDPIVQGPLRPYIDSGLLWIELTNECPIDAHLAWWAEWLDAALDYAEAHNWPPLAVLGLGPGHGSFAMFSALQAPLMRNHAAGGLLAMHIYEPPESCGGDGSLADGSPWCAYRHRINYDIIHHVIGYDVRIVITEVAPGWGNTQVTPAVLIDLARWVVNVFNDEGLFGVFFWLVGYHPTWPLANLEDWLNQFAQILIQHLQ